ncbi:hypothetical protein [uncultured Ruminobacter sp.]|uniref:hypothetical protein n=1 Tax=uncultured Ruminobacter sp. TaxID=538947 RepID=UPI0025E8D0B8|nr:hypothetical protein [uncultured Ruminobacter sp.]
MTSIIPAEYDEKASGADGRLLYGLNIVSAKQKEYVYLPLTMILTHMKDNIKIKRAVL